MKQEFDIYLEEDVLVMEEQDDLDVSGAAFMQGYLKEDAIPV